MLTRECFLYLQYWRIVEELLEFRGVERQPVADIFVNSDKNIRSTIEKMKIFKLVAKTTKRITLFVVKLLALVKRVGLAYKVLGVLIALSKDLF